MCSTLKYIVFSLFFDAIASSPYNIARYNGIYNAESASPRRLPSYMSPTPTAVDLQFNEEIRRPSNNLRDARSLNNNAYEKEYSITNEQLPSVAQSTSSYANPSFTLNGNEVLRHLLRQNRQIVNKVVESRDPDKDSDIQRRFDQIQLQENTRAEALSQVENNNLKIQSALEQRIAFQPPVFPTVPDLDAYRPAIPVKFNVDREWSNIAKEQPKLPDFIAERLRYPVDFQRRQINGQQVHKTLNAELTSIGQKYNIQKIISNQRIQNVLSSTQQTKRYLVIHPNGTVEQVDNIAPITAQHPNYVLVNAGHVVPANQPETDVNIDESNVQILAAPILEPISSSKVTVVPGAQLPDPLIKNEEAVVDLETTSPETSTIMEATPSSESPITPEPVVASSSTTAAIIPSSTTPTLKPNSETAESNVCQEQEASEKSHGDEDESVIETSSSSNVAADNSESIEETSKHIANVVESSSTTPVAISTESVTENDAPEVTSGPANEAENADASVDLENTSENESNSIVKSTQNTENSEDAETDDISELDSVDARRAGKPMVYYTSDPDFWTKVTEGKDSNIIYFFDVKSSPRIETDRQRTIYPDGTILEELTETVWDGEGGEPKVTKSSKLIHPDDL